MLPFDRLTKRQLGIVKLIVQGLRNKDIAQALDLEVETVHRHVSNIANTLGCRNRTTLTMHWYTSGEAFQSLQAELDATKAELFTLKAAYRALQKLAPYAR